MENKRVNFTYIDILRIFSMFSVVGLHTVADNLRFYRLTTNWHFANIVTSLLSIAVPVFFMISGALILSSPKAASLKYTYKKRLTKILVPFLVWSLLAILYYFLIGYFFYGKKVNFEPTIYRLTHLLGQPVTIHLWFVYALVPLYILSPILKVLVDNMSEKTAKYALFIWFFFSSVMLTVARLVDPEIKETVMLSYNYNLDFMDGYIGYFILGYYLHNTKRKFSCDILLSVIVICYTLIFGGTWIYQNMCTDYFEGFKVYSGTFILVMSVAVFLFVKQLCENHEFKRGTLARIKFFSSVSYMVYLVHNLLIHYMSINEWIVIENIFNTVLRFVIVCAVSVILTVLLGSTKATSYVFTGVDYKTACKTFNLQYLFGRKEK